MEYTCILLAAGRGTRTGLDYNKAFFILEDGRSVLGHSVDLFNQDSDCQKIVIVCAENEKNLVESQYAGEKVCCVAGGETRQDSVWNGLQQADTDYVMIHDAARPYLKRERLEDLKDCLRDYQACLLAVPSVDTIKIVNDDLEVVQTPERKLVWNAQTPQAFLTDLIKSVHEQARRLRYQGTDDVSLVEAFSSQPVKIVKSDTGNIKITNPEDVRKSKA